LVASYLGPFSIVLLGWLAGGAANWAADALPARSASAANRQPQGEALETESATTHAIGPNERPVGNTESPMSPTETQRGAPPPPRFPGAALHCLTLPWYPFRRGVCPHCGERRSIRVPLLEASTILTFFLAWWRFRADPLRLAVVCLYVVFLLAVLVIDFEHRRVLNVMLAPAAVVALLVSFLPGAPDPLQALLGGALGFGIFLLLGLLSRGAMGAGDIKLAGVIGLMIGYPPIISALLLGVALGGAAAAVLLVARRAGRKSTMAYAPYLAVGAIVVLLMQS
jgi:prepilin signal peptidase PulO-like enzyme (type II secretory pathway)